jgi:hypothetical protein
MRTPSRTSNAKPSNHGNPRAAAARFPQLRHAAQLHACSAVRVLRPHATADLVRRGHREMLFEFLIEIRVEAARMQNALHP